jgi:hypothetical protein
MNQAVLIDVWRGTRVSSSGLSVQKRSNPAETPRRVTPHNLTRPHVRKGIVQWTALEREPHTV